MVGNELAVSLFINPVVWQLDDTAQAMALRRFARILGRVMPFWYAFSLLLFAIEAILRRHQSALSLLLVGILIWTAVIVFTVSVLVPINNRIANLEGPMDVQSRQAHKRWDRLHRLRILLLIAATVCVTSAILGAR